MVTDCIPALALSLEKQEPGIMERPPRKKGSSIFSDGVGFDIVYQGIVISLLIICSYFTGYYFEYGYVGIGASSIGTTMAFFTTCMVGCFHALNMRSRHQSLFKLKSKNVLLILSVIVSFLLTTVICIVPFLSNAFNVAVLSLNQLLISLLFGFVIIPIVEVIKFFQRRFYNKNTMQQK